MKMISFENAYQWLDRFEYSESHLDNVNQRFIHQLDQAFNAGNFRSVQFYLDLLLNSANNIDEDMNKQPLLFVIVAKYNYLLGEYPTAEQLLRQASQSYYPRQYEVGVVQWLLGCVLWKIPGKERNAITSWQKSIQIFQALRDSKTLFDDELSTWYSHTLQEMEDSLLSAVNYGVVPDEPEPKYSDKENENQLEIDGNFGVLKVPLADIISAHDLVEILSLVDDVYRQHSETPEGDQLTIYHLEIGTPNIVEFFGQVENLMAVLGALGTALGLVSATIKIVKTKYEIQGLKLENQLLKLAVIEKEMDIEDKKREREPPASTTKRDVSLRTDEIHIRKLIPEQKNQVEIGSRARKVSHLIGEPTLTIISEARPAENFQDPRTPPQP